MEHADGETKGARLESKDCADHTTLENPAVGKHLARSAESDTHSVRNSGWPMTNLGGGPDSFCENVSMGSLPSDRLSPDSGFGSPIKLSLLQATAPAAAHINAAKVRSRSKGGCEIRVHFCAF